MIVGRHRLEVRGDLPVPELADVEVALHAVDALGPDPAEEDVARRLEQPLALHDALSVVGVPALARVRLEHRRLRLLDLEEQRVGVVLAQHEHDPAPGTDAPDPDDLAGEVDEAIALQEAAADPVAGCAGRCGTAR